MQEDTHNGNPVNATDTITISVTGPGGYSRTYTAAASGGVATFNLRGYALTAVGGYTYTATVASDTSIKLAVAAEAVNLGAGMRVNEFSGGGQSAVFQQVFATPLQVIVTDADNNPVSGAKVTFTAPGSGASARLSGNWATTDSTGKADVTATANGSACSFTVTATVSGATAASFSLTNAKAAPTITWAKPAANSA